MVIPIIVLFFPKFIKCIDCTNFGDNCLKCDSQKCTLCDDYFGIDTNSMSENYKKCVPCKHNTQDAKECKKCNNNYEICEYCEDGYGLDKRDDSETYNTCIPGCSWYCCKRCNKDYQKCLECNENSGKNLETSTPDDLKCHPCRQSCETCTNDYTNCEKCKKGAGYNNGNKIPQENIICIPCDDGCSSCTDDYTKCDTCSPGFYLNKITNLCEKCISMKCTDCSENKYNCTKCDKFYGLVKIPNDESSDLYTCEECSPKCEECFDSTCIKCQEGYGLNGLGNCIKCKDDKCNKCSINFLSCTECQKGFFVDNDEESLTFGECIRCSQNCSSCNNEKQCSDCIYGYGFHAKME